MTLLSRKTDWRLTDDVRVLFEHALLDGSQAAYAFCDRSERPARGAASLRSHTRGFLS